jgi:serine O-acetyltransferase
MIRVSEQNMNISRLVSSIVASYEKHSGPKTFNTEYLPDKAEVTRIIETFRKVLFPGYFDQNETGVVQEYRVGSLLTEGGLALRQQICRALHLEEEKDGLHEQLYKKAGDICASFLNKLPEIRDLLLDDVCAAFDGDPAARNEHEIIFAYPGFFAISVYRMAHELHLLSVPLLPRMMAEHAHGLTGIDIHPGARIGRSFFIDHGSGVVIGETTVIGDHVKLYQGVTLGGLSTRGGQSLRGKKRHPTIEDNVTVYSGASILGGETVIGEGCVIGGNSFIVQSVPPNTRVSMRNVDLVFKGPSDESLV